MKKNNLDMGAENFTQMDRFWNEAKSGEKK
jgi:hypothetical protein